MLQKIQISRRTFVCEQLFVYCQRHVIVEFFLFAITGLVYSFLLSF